MYDQSWWKQTELGGYISFKKVKMISAPVVLEDAGVTTQGTMSAPLSPSILLSSMQGDRVEVMLEKESGATPQKKVRGGDPPSR